MLLACLFVFVGVCYIVVGFAFFGCFYFACNSAFLFAYLFVFVWLNGVAYIFVFIRGCWVILMWCFVFAFLWGGVIDYVIVVLFACGLVCCKWLIIVCLLHYFNSTFFAFGFVFLIALAKYVKFVFLIAFNIGVVKKKNRQNLAVHY